MSGQDLINLDKPNVERLFFQSKDCVHLWSRGLGLFFNVTMLHSGTMVHVCAYVKVLLGRIILKVVVLDKD